MPITRTKLLTNSGYAPTVPSSEAQARSVVDDSIREVADLLDAAKPDTNTVLTKTNTGAYTPTTQYHPATKGYVDGVAVSATVPLGSLTDPYLSSAAGNIKPRLSELEIDVDIVRIAKPDTGTANTYVVNTPGTFDRTIDGNLLPFIPANTNTGASTIAEDGATAKAIKKFDIGANAYVDLEAEDIKKNTPINLTWSLSNDFFVLAPRSGAVTKTDIAALSSSASGTTLKLKPPKTCFNGVDGNVTITDVDFIASNIKNGIDLFGKVGTYLAGSEVSNTLVIIETGLESTYNTIGTSATKKKFTFSTGGNYRLNYLLRSNNVANRVDLTITKNGSPFLIVTGTTSTSYVEFNTDITVANGDYIELKITNSANGYAGYLDEVKIKSTLAVIKDIDIA